MERKEIGERIKARRRQLNITQTIVSKAVGVTQGTYSGYESGTIDPMPKINEIAKALKTTASALLSEHENIDMSSIKPLAGDNVIKLPILADIPAGLPEYSEKDVEFFWDIPRFLFPGADFVIRCIGESMYPEIQKDAYCVIRKETEPINRAIMVVKTEEGFTMKRIVKVGDKIELHPANEGHKVIKPKELKIIGEVIGTWNRIKPR